MVVTQKRASGCPVWRQAQCVHVSRDGSQRSFIGTPYTVSFSPVDTLSKLLSRLSSQHIHAFRQDLFAGVFKHPSHIARQANMGELTELVVDTVKNLPNLPTHLKIAFSIFTLIFLFQTVSLLLRPTIEGIDLPKFYIFIFIVAPIPRDILLSETTFRHIDQDGKDCGSKPLGYWKKTFDAKKKAAQQRGDFSNKVPDIEDAEVFISLVVPAFNEEERLGKMLAEAVDYLEQQYGIAAGAQLANGNLHQRKSNKTDSANGVLSSPNPHPIGWEILVISDGSKDKTTDTALAFARSQSAAVAQSIRVTSLVENRGKGGAVTHGMRHVRGQYVLFADADGASKFEDLGKLVQEAKKIEDVKGRAVVVGSRAHLVGSEEVVKV